MKIAVVSDIHDQLDNLEWFLEEVKKRKVEMIFGLGDYSSLYVVERLLRAGKKTVLVKGNNDANLVGMKQAVDQVEGAEFSTDVFLEYELDGDLYFLTHFPLLAENAARSGKYKAVFYGHTHHQRKDVIGQTVLVNPGKLAAYPEGSVSFIVFNPVDSLVEFVERS